MFSGFSSIANKLFGKNSSAATGKGQLALPAEQYLAQEVDGANTLVVGQAGSGKSILMSNLAKSLNHCTVLIKIGDIALPGWEDAPFHGEFFPENGEPSYSVELEDILKTRPAGRMELEFPVNALVGACAVDTKAALEQVLTHIYSYSGSRHLNLAIDDAEALLENDAADRLVTNGRKHRCAAILGVQSPTAFDRKPFDNSSHLIALRCVGGRNELAQRTGLPLEDFLQLNVGELWYHNDRVKTRLKLRATPPSH